MKTSLKIISTPLASIFGSGFLVIVPILAGVVGIYAPAAMLAICALAWLVGVTVRYNIRYAEPVLAGQTSGALVVLERAADLALVLAYMISVCLYLHILSAFVLSGFGADSVVNEDLLTTAIIVLITLIGMFRGLSIMEKLEGWALMVTLCIIVLLTASFAWYDFVANGPGTWVWPSQPERTPWEVLTILGGALIVVQGFETTRYLGAEYAANTRIRAARWAQAISTVVYVIFVSLTVPSLHALNGNYDDNSLVALTGIAAALMVVPLIIAAALSQFSAAVADTLAASGNLGELTSNRLEPRWGYLLVGLVAISLTWVGHTYEILALASRAFAFYYMLQCLVAFSVSRSNVQRAGFIALAVVMACITLFAVPAG